MNGPSYANLLEVIRQVHQTQADDLCWMDIDKIFAAAGLPVPDRRVGDKKAMKENCDKFIDTMCKSGKWISYEELRKDLEKEIARRTYYQDIVYKVCNSLDRIFKRKAGSGMVCGTVEEPRDRVQQEASLLAKVLVKLDGASKGCPNCEYEEADGDLYCHCGRCQESITKIVWEFFNS